jgi:hypothetical protein
MIEQEFLVSTHLAWEPENLLNQCLVTWEVFGGGLMGNLLTDSSNVELSLWPDTKYRVQVTCKNEVSVFVVAVFFFVLRFRFLFFVLYLRFYCIKSTARQERNNAFFCCTLCLFSYRIIWCSVSSRTWWLSIE